MRLFFLASPCSAGACVCAGARRFATGNPPKTRYLSPGGVLRGCGDLVRAWTSLRQSPPFILRVLARRRRPRFGCGRAGSRRASHKVTQPTSRAHARAEGGVMKRRLAALATVMSIVAVFTAVTIAPAASAAPPTATIGNLTGTTATGGTFTGTLANAHFANVNGVLTLVGNLTGTLISVPVSGAAGSGGCTILDLTLGPLHLDLLGLVVDLNQVHLTITGQT